MGLLYRPIKFAAMKTIVIASRKGGTGKTTTTRNIAVALLNRGYKVLLIDTDSQGSLTLWWKARKQDDINLAIVPYDLIGTSLRNAEKAGYDFVLIDTPPESNSTIESTVKFADFILIPLKAGADDLRAVSQTLQLIKQVSKPFAFLLNEISPNTTITRQAAEALSQYGILAPSQCRRVVHAEASAQGLTCIDLRKSSSASREVFALTDYVLDKLQETNND